MADPSLPAAAAPRPSRYSPEEWDARVRLAAAYRIFDRRVFHRAHARYCAIIRGFTNTRPGGEIGRRRGLKIPLRKECRFDSGPGHHL